MYFDFFLGVSREASYAISVDAQYVFMPGAVVDGSPVVFRVDAVMGMIT